MRRLLPAAAALLASLAVAAPPAAADGALYFEGMAGYNCYGCGTSSGTAALCMSGVAQGQAVACLLTGPNERADFDVVMPGGIQCVITEEASGVMSGVVTLTFAWTRIGAVGVLSVRGDVDGQGVVEFRVVNPLGVPCGGIADVELRGWFAGT